MCKGEMWKSRERERRRVAESKLICCIDMEEGRDNEAMGSLQSHYF